MRAAQGHLLLVGVGGSGKQSLGRLAAFAAGCAVFEVQLKRGYGRAAFLEDLKALYTLLGQDNKKVRPRACIAHEPANWYVPGLKPKFRDWHSAHVRTRAYPSVSWAGIQASTREVPLPSSCRGRSNANRSRA